MSIPIYFGRMNVGDLNTALKPSTSRFQRRRLSTVFDNTSSSGSLVIIGV